MHDNDTTQTMSKKAYLRRPVTIFLGLLIAVPVFALANNPPPGTPSAVWLGKNANEVIIGWLADTEADVAFHRFAAHLGEAQAVSLSPDGRTLAFVAASVEEGKLGIYTVDPLGPRVLEHTPVDLGRSDKCFS